MLGRRIGVALLAAGLSLGCEQAQDPVEGDKGAAVTSATSAPSAAPAQKQATRASSAASPLARIQLDAPAEWTKQARGGWQIHTSADQKSVLALGAIDEGETTKTALEEAAPILGITEAQWAEETPIHIGPDQLAARASDGPCRFRGGEARVAYAAVDVGEGEKVLVVHVAAKDAPADAQKTAMTAVGSLRRKN